MKVLKLSAQGLPQSWISLEQAVTHYERVAALVPNAAGAHNNLANALMELGRLEAALAHRADTRATAA